MVNSFFHPMAWLCSRMLCLQLSTNSIKDLTENHKCWMVIEFSGIQSFFVFFIWREQESLTNNIWAIFFFFLCTFKPWAIKQYPLLVQKKKTNVSLSYKCLSGAPTLVRPAKPWSYLPYMHYHNLLMIRNCS